MFYGIYDEELKLYQVAAGLEGGKLLFAIAVLSDAQCLLDSSMLSNNAKEHIKSEISKAKELIVDALAQLTVKK